MNIDKKNILLIIIVSLVALSARFIEHLPNFSPLASVMLFTAVYARDKKYLALPFVALFISDIFIGFYKWEIMVAVYLSLLVGAALGFWLKINLNILNTISASLASALIFFLISNGAVWYFGSWYSHDLAGLALCYNLALPFFKATLLSNLAYSALLFGGYESLKKYSHQKKLSLSK